VARQQTVDVVWQGGQTLPQFATTGVPGSYENAPSKEPTVGLCLGSYGGPKGVGVFL